MRKGIRFNQVALAAGTVAFMSAGPAFASLEKTIPFSGKYGGEGGVTTSIVQGSQSLFFNPAGMAGSEGLELTSNFSPSIIEFGGPVTVANVNNSTGSQFVPLGSMSAAYGITKQWAVGLGFGTMGGSKAEFLGLPTPAGLDAFGVNYTPDYIANLAILELNVGSAYEILPGLKIGADWRISFLNGKYVIPKLYPTGFGEIAIDDIKKTQYNGFRFGAQYTSEDKRWGLGASMRTPLDITGKGTSSGKMQAFGGGAVTDVSGGGDTYVSLSLPTRIQVGGNLAPADHWMLASDVIWTEYHRDQYLSVSGQLPTGLSAFETNLGWKNNWSFRLGGEYTGIESWALRAGYNLTTPDLPAEHATAGNAPPGLAHGVTVGAGKSLLGNALSVDGAFEYSWASGSVTAEQAISPTVPGDFSAHVISFHLGATYHL